MHCGSWKADASLMAFTQTIPTSTELFISCVISCRHEGQEIAATAHWKKGLNRHTHTHRRIV